MIIRGYQSKRANCQVFIEYRQDATDLSQVPYQVLTNLEPLTYMGITQAGADDEQDIKMVGYALRTRRTYA